jgi:hypothetical protein
MTWQARCRWIAQDYERVVVTSFPGMSALYTDFAEFRSHDHPGRALSWPGKQYRNPTQKWVKFGEPHHVKDILIHARGIRRSNTKNYRYWHELKLDAGYIGLNTCDDNADHCSGDDFRNIPLKLLLNIIAGARVVIGQSSGIMHLAQLCGTPIVVWGDDRTYFGETLEKRYKETWNPLKTEVHWVHCDDWQPKPDDVLREVRDVVERGK